MSSLKKYIQHIGKNVSELAKAYNELVELEIRITNVIQLMDEKTYQQLCSTLISYRASLLQRLTIPAWQPMTEEPDVPGPKIRKPPEPISINQQMDDNGLLNLPLKSFTQLMRRRYIEQIIQRHSGNVVKAARSLGMSRVSVYNILRSAKSLTVPETGNSSTSKELQ